MPHTILPISVLFTFTQTITIVPTFLINFNKMSTFNDQFLLASLNHEQYMAQQQLAIQLAQAKAAEMDNSTTAAIKTPFDPAAYDLVQESI